MKNYIYLLLLLSFFQACGIRISHSNSGLNSQRKVPVETLNDSLETIHDSFTFIQNKDKPEILDVIIEMNRNQASLKVGKNSTACQKTTEAQSDSKNESLWQEALEILQTENSNELNGVSNITLFDAQIADRLENSSLAVGDLESRFVYLSKDSKWFSFREKLLKDCLTAHPL